ncbi:hypothetical protein OG851_36390 [Streptomyces sp. NBC_00161]|uniref:hypothetical protein n=1 Tax=Streptomyces sp. NBC_00161 TaxID=2975671 RepID=UPI003243F87C
MPIETGNAGSLARPGRTRPARPRRSGPAAELTPVKLDLDPAGTATTCVLDTSVATKHW